MAKKYDFAGWATRANQHCSDGTTIRRGAFRHNDGKRVPLVWMHGHDDPADILGHADLSYNDDGVRAECAFNDSDGAVSAKIGVLHGDLTNLSIYANHLSRKGNDILDGDIKEVSLVISGANPGACIDSIALAHGDDIPTDEGIIYTDEVIDFDFVEHSDEKKKKKSEEESEKDTDEEEASDEADDTEGKEEEDMDEKKKKSIQHADEEASGDETIQDVFDTLSDKQKDAVYAIIGMALEGEGGDEVQQSDFEEDNNMRHNVFDVQATDRKDVLSHDDMMTILDDGKRFGTLKESVIQHADDYGIKQIDWLFPEAKNLNTPPDWIKRETTWVQGVLSGTHKTPFSRIKSMFADIREDEARARGYIKGNRKKEEVFTLLKRTTDPQTIYKKQKLDRDDIIDITDFDVVAWIKGEMRMMLDEEIARAILIGDGRLASSDDKIQEQHVRSILNDDELYSVKIGVDAKPTDDMTGRTNKIIDEIIRSRKQYKGSGNPKFYTTEDFVTDCLLLKDSIGYRIYKTEEELRTALRVSEIVTVPVMEGAKRTTATGEEKDLIGIIVNLSDYNVGADKGGAINMFDDFDIDYNQMKYLIETRISGALIKPYSALVIEYDPTSGTDGANG